MLKRLRDWIARRRHPVIRPHPTPPTPIPVPKPSPAPAPTPAPAPAPAPDIPAALLAGHNVARLAKGLAPLAASARLDMSAARHAAAMAAARTMSHQLPGEADLGGRLQAAGYAYSTAAENIASSYPDVASVMSAWLTHPPHAENILGPYHEMGAAMARDAGGTPYWAVDFGTASTGSFGSSPGSVPQVITIEGDRISCTYSIPR